MDVGAYPKLGISDVRKPRAKGEKILASSPCSLCLVVNVLEVRRRFAGLGKGHLLALLLLP